MQEKNLFEYAVIRIVPQVEREEFLNVGVVVYCAKTKFLATKFKLDVDRLQAFCNHCDSLEIEEYLHSFERICIGGIDAGPIGQLPMPDRFRWLTATRSTVVQTSKVHSGLTDDLSEILRNLFDQLVAVNTR